MDHSVRNEMVQKRERGNIKVFDGAEGWLEDFGEISFNIYFTISPRFNYVWEPIERKHLITGREKAQTSQISRNSNQ